MYLKILNLVLLFLVIFLFGFQVLKHEDSYIHMSDRIFNQYIKDVKRRYSLYCVGSGGGFLDQVNEIYVAFNCIGPLTLEELRDLLVEATEELLNRYNEDEEIRPYLKNYPFTVDNCVVNIHLKDKDGNLIKNSGSDKTYLFSIYLGKGIVTYDIINDEKEASQEVYRETYVEALNIVRSSRNQLRK